MLTVKRIVCLANSTKHSGRCVAGVELVDGAQLKWIRPISSRSGHEVEMSERRLPDGSDPDVLDIIEIGLAEAVPSGYQSENWRLDPSHQWQRVGRTPYADLAALVETPAKLWTNGYSSSGGVNDRVPEAELATHKRSIGLIRPDGLEVRVATSPWKVEVRAQFTYGEEQYRLKVTDPVNVSRFMEAGNGEYTIDEAFLTVSLAEPWTAPSEGAEAYAYKVVASIIEPSGSLGDAP